MDKEDQQELDKFYCVLMAERLATTAETPIKTGLEAHHRWEVGWGQTGGHFGPSGPGSFTFEAERSS